jgi:hypothetical protein
MVKLPELVLYRFIASDPWALMVTLLEDALLSTSKIQMVVPSTDAEMAGSVTVSAPLDVPAPYIFPDERMIDNVILLVDGISEEIKPLR